MAPERGWLPPLIQKSLRSKRTYSPFSFRRQVGQSQRSDVVPGHRGGEGIPLHPRHLEPRARHQLRDG